MAVVAACSEGSSRSKSGEDAGKAGGDASADLVSEDVRGRADTVGTPDAVMDALRGPEAQPTDDARSGPEVGDVSADVESKPETSPDSARGADAGQRSEAGAEAGGDLGRGADAQFPTDSRSQGADGGSIPDGDPCAGGTTYSDSTSGRSTLDSYGWVRLPVSANNKILSFDTTMVVPDTPPPSGTLFLWPGLQPVSGGANYALLDNGVLQPVLTWGPTCAPNAPAQSYKSWWISGQYVNTNIPSSSPNYAAYNDCHGGPGMNVSVGDTLDMRFALSGSDWTQTVSNRRNAQSVTYTVDLLGQAQGAAEFVIEEYSSKPLADVIFTSSVITFASSAKSACQNLQRGTNDYFTAPRASADGLRCCIDKVVLRAEGVPATTPNTP